VALPDGSVGREREDRAADQGKFNAAEKINFMVLVSTYPPTSSPAS